MKMKKISSVFLLAFSLTGFSLFAAEGVYLPDIITVVEDTSEAFVPEIKIDVSEEIILPEGTIAGDLKIPEVKKEDSLPQEKVIEKKLEPEILEPVKNDFSIMGFTKIGMNGSILGNIFLNSNSKNPFHFGMTYNSLKDLIHKSEAKGIYEKEFSLNGGKIFSSEDNKNIWKINGSVFESERGFQGKGPGTSYSQSDYKLSGEYNRLLPYGFEISCGLDSDFYFRSIDNVDNINAILIGKSGQENFCYLKPDFSALWSNKDFQVSLSGNYSWENNGTGSTHRGYTGAEIQWQNDNILLFGTVGALFGNKIGQSICLVPFSLQSQFHFPVPFAENEVFVSLQGGLDSEGKTASFLEQICPYSVFDSISFSKFGEVTDWFGNLDFYMPLPAGFGFNLNFEYRKTAFGNGFLQPVYSEAAMENGLYGFKAYDRQLITSSESISYNSEHLNAALSWTSYFDYVPVFVPTQEICLYADAEFNGFRLSGDLVLPFVSADKTPGLSFEGSYEVNSGLRIAIIVEDTVKLINGQSRLAFGQYTRSNGSVSLMLNFNF